MVDRHRRYRVADRDLIEIAVGPLRRPVDESDRLVLGEQPDPSSARRRIAEQRQDQPRDARLLRWKSERQLGEPERERLDLGCVAIQICVLRRDLDQTLERALAFDLPGLREPDRALANIRAIILEQATHGRPHQAGNHVIRPPLDEVPRIVVAERRRAQCALSQRGFRVLDRGRGIRRGRPHPVRRWPLASLRGPPLDDRAEAVWRLCDRRAELVFVTRPLFSVAVVADDDDDPAGPHHVRREDPTAADLERLTVAERRHHVLEVGLGHSTTSVPRPFLVRVDGELLTYEIWTSPAISPYGIAVDTEGRPWIAGFTGGVSRFDPATETFQTNADTPGLGMMPDAQGRMWVATHPTAGNGVFALDVNTMAQVEWFDLPTSLAWGIEPRHESRGMIRDGGRGPRLQPRAVSLIAR